MKPINSQETAQHLLGLPKSGAGDALLINLAEGTPSGPTSQVQKGNPFCPPHYIGRAQDAFGEIRAHGCHFFILLPSPVFGREP